jgi:hypothetical protein
VSRRRSPRPDPTRGELKLEKHQATASAASSVSVSGRVAGFAKIQLVPDPARGELKLEKQQATARLMKSTLRFPVIHVGSIGVMSPSRILSLMACAALFAIVGFARQSFEAIVYLALALLFPMACIWFSEDMGSYTNPYAHHRYPTSGIMVWIGGWILLLAVAFAYAILPLVA